MFAVLWLVGWTLRVPILSAPPLATLIADSFGLGEAGTGALTMLPLVAVAFGALPAAWLIARFGLRASIASGIVIMALASIARGYVPSAALLFAVSILMGLGVAVFQTALPAAARTWTPSHAALGSAVYLNGMMVGEFSGAGLTLPLVLPMAGGDWRTALVIWAVPVLIIAVVAYLVRPKMGGDSEDKEDDHRPGTRSPLPRWNDGQVWQFGLLLACSIVIFYAINAYAGSVLRARGEEQALAGLLFAFNLTPLLASFVVLAAPHWIGYRNPLGVASTIELILLVSIPAAIAKGLGITRMSAGTTLIGYAIAFVIPLIGGWIAEETGRIEVALLPALAFSIVMIPALGRTRRYVCASLARVESEP
jgi:CP family cyanate transporter-like MFS transporter